VFGLVECGISSLNERACKLACRGRAGSHTDADRNEAAIRAREAELLDSGSNPVCNDYGSLAPCVRQHNGKLLATIPRRLISRAESLIGDGSSDAPQAIIARLMARTIVEALEVVDVDDQEGDRQAITLRPPPFAR
jgi:hypothetical protein